MIECLVKSANVEAGVHVGLLERAIRPSVPHTLGPGPWTIDLGGDRFVDFSPEFAGLQLTFDDEIERALAERVAADVAANLAALTQTSCEIVWLS